MTSFADYFKWLEDGRWIRISSRALIFDDAEEHLLVEHVQGNAYHNFIGGGVEIGETLQECVQRELSEEMDAEILECKHLFVVENFFHHNGEPRHALEHYFQVKLDRYQVVPKNDGVQFIWKPLKDLSAVDILPIAVRDIVADGSYKKIDHIVNRD